MTPRKLAAVPTGEVPVPAAVAEYARRHSVPAEGITPVWRNTVGGLTFRLAAAEGERYAKWSPASAGINLRREAERLAWAVAFTPVPEVLDFSVHGFTEHDDAGHLLVTAAVPGESAVAPRWLARPEEAAHALGAGLRALHDALPVEDCPFDWSLTSRLARAKDPERGRDLAAADPGVSRLVVCHGDACAPNTLLDAGGKWIAHVDLGSLGVADLWADLAVAAWSTEWNYGRGYADLVYAGYGIEPDAERIAFYRAVWDAT